MHDISFESRTPTHYTAVIDGVAIEFSTAMNKISFGDCAALSEYVNCIEQHLANGLPLAPLSKQINGVNMLRLLNSLFREQIIQEWILFISADMSIPTKKAFENYFGFTHNKTLYPFEFGSILYDMSVKQHNNMKEKAQKDAEEEKRICRRDRTLQNIASEIEKDHAVSCSWVVARSQISRNVVLYRINGHQFTFCLTNHSFLNSAKNVAEVLGSLEEAFHSKNCSAIRQIIKSIGGKAAFQIMGTLFNNEAKQFFQFDFSEYVIAKRTKPAPYAYLKTYFGGSCGSGDLFYLELLAILEDSIPELEQRLIQSSVEEMSSKSDEWRLFYYSRSIFGMCLIKLPVSNPLCKEIREYLVYKYNQLTNSGIEPVPILYEINRSISNIIEVVGRPIVSALDLSVWDFRSAIASMSKKVKVATIRVDLFRTRSFITYLNPDFAEKTIPLSIIPVQVLNPNEPLSPSVILNIAEHYAELPTYVWLAFQVFAWTGARAGSVFDLTVDDLVRTDDGWVLHIYYGKAAARNYQSGTPSYRPLLIPDHLAQSIFKYISETEHLRRSFSKQYIFVYDSPWFRQGSSRKPRVLSPSNLAIVIRNLCATHSIFNDDGTLPNVSTQGIRAEVGRALFAKGASPEAVASVLGNTAPVAKRHYDKMYPADEAAMRRELYAQTTDTAIDPTGIDEIFPFAKNDPMYGSCKKPGACMIANDCRTCPEQIIKKQKEV